MPSGRVCSAPLASSTSPPQIFGTVRHRWIDDIEALRSKINPANLPARSLDSLHLAPAVIAPEKITCVGLNYRRHALEAGFPVPTTPVIFGKFANSLAGSGTSVALPDVDTKYDFESELGVIIGRAARNVPVEAALDYVAGYCCANDLSARGAQLATSQWMIGKMLDGFLPLGKYLVTADTVKDSQSLGIRCRVNGELGARVRTGGPRRGAEAPRRSGLKRECLRDFGLTWPT